MYAQQYVENDLVDKTPVELVRLLYSKAIEKTTQAAAHTRNGEVRERSLCLARVMEIIAELQGSLNHEAGGELALELGRLYDYIQSQLIAAAGDAKAEAQLGEVAVLLGNLFGGWRDCEPPAAAEQGQPEIAANRVLIFPAPPDRGSRNGRPEEEFAFRPSRSSDDLQASAISDAPRESRVWTL